MTEPIVTRDALERIERNLIDRIGTESAHAADLRKADAELAKAHRELMDERDKRYTETNLTNKEALKVTERALTEYKATANEWRGAINDIISKIGGKDEALKEAQAAKRWTIGVGLTLLLFVLAQAMGLLK